MFYRGIISTYGETTPSDSALVLSKSGVLISRKKYRKIGTYGESDYETVNRLVNVSISRYRG